MPVSFSFGGAGYYFPVMLGVAYELKRQLKVDWRKVRVHSVSSGISGALALLLATPAEIKALTQRGIALAHAAYRPEELPGLMIPPNAASQLGPRLGIGVTDFPLMKAQILSSPFSSQEKLLAAVQESCRIPLLTGGFSSVLDGGFSHQYARLDEHTIVITLKAKKGSDLHLDIPLFLEMIRPSIPQMWELFEAGRELVNEHLPLLKAKVAAGLESEVTEWTPIKY